MNTTENNSRKGLRLITGIGIFSAFAFVVSLVCEVFPNVAGFLSIDLKDAVIAIASFIYGPLAAPAISLIVAAVELVSIGSDTGWYGFVMNFASSATFSLVASLIYSRKKTVNTALIGLLSAVLATTSVMIVLNAFVTPIFVAQRGIPFDVLPNLPVLFLPFNFAKTLLNSAATMLLYKPIINAMRKAKLIPGLGYKTTFNKNTVKVLIIGGAALILSVAILFILLIIN